MSTSLLQPQGNLSPAEALRLAQQAPTILRNNPKAFSSSPLRFLFSATETPELWIIYENLLLSCLRTGDDQSAHQCLERLVVRFGNDNQRIMALKGIVKEVEAPDTAALETILNEYDEILAAVAEGGTNIPIAKRRVALARSLGRDSDAVTSLISLLDYTPTDAEAWSELSDIYISQGLYPQAIYALEEVLVLAPNAWNMQARLGEVLYMAGTTSGGVDSSAQKYLAESIKRFCRSVELCDDYLRGYYGLKLVTDKVLSLGDSTKTPRQGESEDMALPDTTTVQALNRTATEKLAEIVRRHGAKEAHWQGYGESEVAAARELLRKSSVEVVR